MRTVFFLINLMVAPLLIFCAVYSLVIPDSGFQFLGAIMMIVPVILYAIGEWLAFYRGQDRIEQLLGFLKLFAAAFVAFGIVSNIGEGIFYGETASPAFWLCFLGIGFTVLAYLLGCGVYRVRGSSSPQLLTPKS